MQFIGLSGILIKNKAIKGGFGMKGIISTTNGNVTIDENVIAKYAGTVAVGCFGIVGMAVISMKDGIVKLLRKDSLTKGINVDIDEDNEVILSFHVIVAYGVSIFTVSDNLISSVKYEVEKFSGLKVKKIQIYVEGVRIID